MPQPEELISKAWEGREETRNNNKNKSKNKNKNKNKKLLSIVTYLIIKLVMANEMSLVLCVFCYQNGLPLTNL